MSKLLHRAWEELKRLLKSNRFTHKFCRGLKCLKEHGLSYTWKLLLKKLIYLVADPDDLLESESYTAEDPAEMLPESLHRNREDADELIDRLSEYDVISFDAFDTLILRVFDTPSDVFRLLGHRLGEESFLKLRAQAEREARKRYKDKTGEVGEINIHEIYEILAEYIKIDPEFGARQELQAEKDCCFANPYLKHVFDELLRRNKEVIIVSDMYLPKDMMAELLESCGYTGYSRLYVSSDYRCTKLTGLLQKEVDKDYPDKKIVHIGDNSVSDIEKSKEIGWEPYFYPSCRELGEGLRPMRLDRLSASAYRGLVNVHLHGDSAVYSPEYEHGFRYAGYMVVGFCEWLNQHVKHNDIDRILFMARDTDIIYKIYNQSFRQVENRYVKVSRLALSEMKFETDPEDFIQDFFRVRAERLRQPMGEALEETDLAPLIPLLEDAGFTADTILTMGNYDAFHDFIMRHHAEVTAHFSDAKRAGQEHFRELIGDAKRVCIVDIGWNGAPLIMMRKLLREMYGDEVSVQGAYMALGSMAHTTGYVESGIVDSYLFHGCMNRHVAINNVTAVGEMQVQFVEATFTSDQCTLLKYTHTPTGEVDFVYGPKVADDELIREIQRGIVDFVALWLDRTAKIRSEIKIMPADAMQIMNCAVKNNRYCYKIFGKNQGWDVPLPNFKGKGRLITFGDMLKSRGMVQTPPDRG